MPYLEILSVFAALVAVQGCVVLCCALVPRLRRVVPYGWRVLVGSSVGFVLGNLGSLLLGAVPVLCAVAFHVDRDDPAAQVVAAFALAGFFVGPLVVSPLGFLGGAWIAFARARRRLARQVAPVRQ